MTQQEALRINNIAFLRTSVVVGSNPTGPTNKLPPTPFLRGAALLVTRFKIGFVKAEVRVQLLSSETQVVLSLNFGLGAYLDEAPIHWCLGVIPAND
jgi:hypothetical protein